MADTTHYQRYARQLLLPGVDEQGQAKIGKACVAIVGIGGLGNIVLPYLVGAGVGKITIIDDDIVSLGNLSRQTLFRPTDIGSAKVGVACREMSALNQHVSIVPHEKRVNADNVASLLASHDVVLDCTDNLASRHLINKQCHITNTPLLSGAASVFDGHYIALHPAHHSGCYQCLHDESKYASSNCLEQGILGPIVAMMGLMQALDTLKLITQIGDIKWGQIQIFNGLSGQWRCFDVPTVPNCPVCGVLQ